MATANRGKKSHTYDITEVLSVDLETLTIAYRDVAHAADQQVRLDVPPTPAARQTLWGMADSISVHGTGMWESGYALQGIASTVKRSLLLLDDVGVSDFSEPSLALRQLRDVIEYFDASQKRTLNKLFCRILRRYHPDGTELARALSNTSYMVKESNVELYDDAEADAIHSAARGLFTAAFKAQRDLLTQLGYDTSDRSWLRIPAERIIADARAAAPELVGARRPRPSEPRIDQIRWALLHPSGFGRPGRGRPGLVTNIVLDGISKALYPPSTVLTAGLIMQCMAELSGLNLSVMLRTEPDDLVYTGKTNGTLHLAKARNHSEDQFAVRITNNSSLGGLVEALSGLTRVSRHWRATKLVSDSGVVPEVVNRLYVEHRRDCEHAEVLTSQRIHNAWRQPDFDAYWPHAADVARPKGLRFQALRRKALERAITTNPKADVHGHSERTRVHYLANVLPEHVLAKTVTDAQHAIIDAAVARFAGADAPERLAAAVRSGESADIVVSVCTSGGNDPDTATKPCSLGLAACFTCPNGYRTVDHIPGLVATVRFAELIRANDPGEWDNGEASLLHFYATESLKQFPSAAVEAVRTNDLADQLVTVGALYSEFRR